MHTHTGRLTLGFGPAVSDEAASLLPGLLTVTRTGLAPASGDELTSQAVNQTSINHPISTGRTGPQNLHLLHSTASPSQLLHHRLRSAFVTHTTWTTKPPSPKADPPTARTCAPAAAATTISRPADTGTPTTRTPPPCGPRPRPAAPTPTPPNRTRWPQTRTCSTRPRSDPPRHRRHPDRPSPNQTRDEKNDTRLECAKE